MPEGKSEPYCSISYQWVKKQQPPTPQLGPGAVLPPRLQGSALGAQGPHAGSYDSESQGSLVELGRGQETCKNGGRIPVPFKHTLIVYRSSWHRFLSLVKECHSYGAVNVNSVNRLLGHTKSKQIRVLFA